MDDYAQFINSQRLLYALAMSTPKKKDDELIFIEFRPHWLSPQRNVYEALSRAACTICMFEIHPSLLARQHNEKHPPICKECFSRLNTCPFCRVTLFSNSTPFLLRTPLRIM